MRGRKLRSHQRTRQLPCPACGKRFANVLRHLNHRDSKCSDWFVAPPSPSFSVSSLPPGFPDNMDDAPLSPSPINSDPDHQPLRVEFSTAGKIYGHGKSFVDYLNDDKYAPYRVRNPYYLFADQEEWELGSFLLRSGMSMQKVDEFLRLKLVNQNSTYFLHHLLISL